MGTMDGIIDTVSATHPIVPLLGLLKSDGKLVMVGAPDKPLEVPAFPLLSGKFAFAARNLNFQIYNVYLPGLSSIQLVMFNV